MSTIHIFVSYSHRDSRWVKAASEGLSQGSRGVGRDTWVQEGTHALIPWLAQQLKKNGVEIWYDHALKQMPGAEYKKLIKSQIDRADIAILLISQDFLTSDFIKEHELPRIRERVDRGDLSLVPILVGPAFDEDLDWLADRQMLPGKPAPLIDYTDSNAKWQAVRLDILKAIRDRAREIADRRLEPATRPAPVASSPPAAGHAQAPPPANQSVAAATTADRAAEKAQPDAGQFASQWAHADDLAEGARAVGGGEEPASVARASSCERSSGSLSRKLVSLGAAMVLLVGLGAATAVFFLSRGRGLPQPPPNTTTGESPLVGQDAAARMGGTERAAPALVPLGTGRALTANTRREAEPVTERSDNPRAMAERANETIAKLSKKEVPVANGLVTSGSAASDARPASREASGNSLFGHYENDLDARVSSGRPA